jgi:SNF2 family DNA or RNA helicase
VKFVAKKYQARTIEYACENKKAGLLLRPGLGKTVSALSAFAILRGDFDANRALVVAPLSVCHLVWPQEVAKWDHLKGLRVRIMHGPEKERHMRARADVYVINPAGLKWLQAQKWDIPDVLIVDEMTAFKHHTTERAKQLRRIVKAGQIERRIGLTGTPAPNGLEDLFGEALMLDDGLTLGDTLKEFRTMFWFGCHPTGDGRSEWGPTTRSEELIYEKAKNLFLRLDGAGELDLPEVVKTDVHVELDDDTLQQYKELKAELLLELELGVVTALNAGALISKCRQLASGGVYVNAQGQVSIAGEDDGVRRAQSWQKTHSAKVEKLGDLYEENGKRQMIVVYDYKHSRERIQDYWQTRFGFRPPAIGGGSKTDDKIKLVNEWNAGTLPVLLGHPQSMGHGLNLQLGGADTVVWFDLTFDLELYDQVNARLDRQGQSAKRVFIYHLLAEDTVDATILRALRNKSAVQTRLLDALREELK